MGIEGPKEWTIRAALLHFLDKWKERGLEKDSLARYDHAVQLLLSFLTILNMDDLPAENIYRQHIETCLSQARNSNTWSNRRYNNVVKYLRTAFNFLVKNDIVKKNPCADIDILRTISKKHRFYDEKTLAKVMETVREQDPYLCFAIQCVYYLCIRSEKELKNFMVKNIFPERMQVLISAGGSKTKSDRYITLNDEMLNIFKDRGILNYSEDHYVFGVKSKTKFEADGEPGLEPFGNGFFSKRFSKIRTKLKLSSDFTIYGFKHTRVIHLKLDGATDAEIMSLTGHSDYGSFAKYLRDIGLGVDGSRIAGLSRKI